MAQGGQRSGDLASSGGGVGGVGGGTGRLKYAAMSRCSSRNNNSGSSGGSYAEALADPTRRPLVVSFRRRSPKTSCSSMGHCCDQPPTSLPPSSIRETTTLPACKEVTPPPQALPVPNDPRVEDIEIFQECQLRIQRSVRRHDPPNRPESCRSAMVVYDNHVRKSLTEPCLASH